jgi:hypothetical protein
MDGITLFGRPIFLLFWCLPHTNCFWICSLIRIPYLFSFTTFIAILMGQAVVLSCKLSSEQMIMRRRGMEREEEEEEASANEGEEVAVEQQQQQQPRRRVQAILKAKQGQQHSSKGWLVGAFQFVKI